MNEEEARASKGPDPRGPEAEGTNGGLFLGCLEAKTHFLAWPKAMRICCPLVASEAVP